MKRLAIRLFVALLTFSIGSMVGYFNRSWHHRLKNPPLPTQSQQESLSLSSSWHVLLSFQNQNLPQLDGTTSDRLYKAIEILVGNNENDGTVYYPREFWPMFFSRIAGSRGQIRYLLVEANRPFTNKRPLFVRASVFDLEGKLISSAKFSPGHHPVGGLRLSYAPEIGREVMSVSTVGYLWGTDQGKKSYALVDDRLTLIRRENCRGQLIRPLTDQTEISGRSAAEWKKDLESNDSVDTLTALTWLTRSGWGREGLRNGSDEERRELRLATEVRSRETRTLKQLSKSENPWLREAAALALTPGDIDRDIDCRVVPPKFTRLPNPSSD